MRIRPAKSRVTDYRPASGQAPSGLDRLATIQAREARQHDEAIAGYDEDLCFAVGEDLLKRSAYNLKDPEHRWIMSRRAALLRRLDRLGALR